MRARGSPAGAERRRKLPSFELFAVSAPGVPEITAAELRELGIVPVKTSTDGVAFTGGYTELIRSNLWSRTATRVLARMGNFRARTFGELERHAAALAWDRFVPHDRRVTFRVTARKCRLFHTGAVAERLGKAARAELVQGSDDDETAGAQLFVVRGVRDEWTVSADSSGVPLHRRGYRLAVAKAPLRETLAAALLLASGWDRRSPLADPFCGSGTIPIEGALLAAGIAPGLGHDFSFARWPDFPADLWESERAAATREPAAASSPILGFDRDAGAIDAARQNAARARMDGAITFARQTISDFAPPAGRGWIVTNPPYGVRVSGAADLRDLYARFGAVLRERCAGWTVVFLSPDPTLERATGLQLEPVLRTINGGLPVRLMLARL